MTTATRSARWLEIGPEIAVFESGSKSSESRLLAKCVVGSWERRVMSRGVSRAPQSAMVAVSCSGVLPSAKTASASPMRLSRSKSNLVCCPSLVTAGPGGGMRCPDGMARTSRLRGRRVKRAVARSNRAWLSRISSTRSASTSMTTPLDANSAPDRASRRMVPEVPLDSSTTSRRFGVTRRPVSIRLDRQGAAGQLSQICELEMACQISDGRLVHAGLNVGMGHDRCWLLLGGRVGSRRGRRCWCRTRWGVRCWLR